MVIELIINEGIEKQIEEKGRPGTALFKKESLEVVAYDPSMIEAYNQAKEKGFSTEDVIGFWLPDPKVKYIFTGFR